MVGAIILAAGASTRMGSPKALLRIGEKTFLQHIVDALTEAGVHDIVIVLGAHAQTIQQDLGWFHRTVVINKQWERGQLSSTITGLHTLSTQNLEAILLCPVDRPLITPTLISGMIKSFKNNRTQIVVPTYSGRRGHPLLVGSSLFHELEHLTGQLGVRELLSNHRNDVLEFSTDNDGIVQNIDTPEDYEINILRPFLHQE